MTSVRVCLVPKESNNQQTDYGFRIKTICNKKESHISLTILDGNSAFVGQLTSEYIEKQASMMRIAPETYFEDATQTLGTQGGRDQYSYSLQNGMFTWKKNPCDSSSIKIKVGSVAVQPVNYENTAVDMIDCILGENNRLSAELKDALTCNQHLLSSTQRMAKNMEEMCAMKDEMEKTLYTKFIQLLNTKKAKMRQLQEMQVNERNNVRNNSVIGDYDFDGDTDADSDDGDGNITTIAVEPESSRKDDSSALFSKTNEEGVVNNDLLMGESCEMDASNACDEYVPAKTECCEKTDKTQRPDEKGERSENDILDQLTDWKSRKQTHFN